MIRFTKTKYKHKLVDNKMITRFKKEYPKFKNVRREKIKNIILEILKEYKREVLINPHGVRLPNLMGDLVIKWVKPSKKPLNRIMTKELGENVEYLNFSTSGKIGKIVWHLDHARHQNKYTTILSFFPKRDFKNEAKNAITETPERIKTARHLNYQSYGKPNK